MYKYYIVVALIAMHFQSHAKFKVTVLESTEPEVVIVPDKGKPKTALNLVEKPIPQKQVMTKTQAINSSPVLPKTINKTVAQLDLGGSSKLPQRTNPPVANINPRAEKGSREATSPLRNAIVQGVRVWSSDDSTRAVFDLSAPTDYKINRLSNPERIEIEFENSIIDGPFALRGNNAIESIVNVGNGKLVMNLKGSVNEKHFMLAPFKNSGYRVVVDLKKSKNKTKTVAQIPTSNKKPLMLNARPSGGKSNILNTKNRPVAVRTVNDMSKVKKVQVKDEGSSVMIKESSLKPLGFNNIAGQQVEHILNNWASEANYTIKYNLGIWSRVKELTISISAEYGNEYTEAVESFLGDLNSTPQLISQNVSLHGCMYMNKVIEITDKECGK